MVQVDVANNLLTLIVSILTILGIVIAFIAWFIRLESKVKYLEKDHGDHKIGQASKDAGVWSKIDAMQTSMNSVLQAIGRVEGKLEVRNDS